MLFLQRQGESIDNGSKNLQKLSNSIEALRFIDELEEDVVDGATDERAQVQELPVDPVKCSLKEIAFSRVF